MSTLKQRAAFYRKLYGDSMIEIEEGVFYNPKFIDRFAPWIQKKIKSKLYEKGQKQTNPKP